MSKIERLLVQEDKKRFDVPVVLTLGYYGPSVISGTQYF